MYYLVVLHVLIESQQQGTQISPFHTVKFCANILFCIFFFYAPWSIRISIWWSHVLGNKMSVVPATKRAFMVRRSADTRTFTSGKARNGISWPWFLHRGKSSWLLYIFIFLFMFQSFFCSLILFFSHDLNRTCTISFQFISANTSMPRSTGHRI